MSENNKDAQDFWSTTDFQRKEYNQNELPFYTRSLLRVIEHLQVKRVFEFGCNSGRNLDLIRRRIDRIEDASGCDINSESIEFGRDKFGLDITVADESIFDSMEENSVDLLFTVSVLDHIPDVKKAMKGILRVTETYILLVEPRPETQLSYLDEFKESGVLPETVQTETPYSYTHDYETITAQFGLTQLLSFPLPPYGHNLGPLYKLSLYTKAGRPEVENLESIKTRLIDEIIFDCSMENLQSGRTRSKLIRQLKEKDAALASAKNSSSGVLSRLISLPIKLARTVLGKTK